MQVTLQPVRGGPLAGFYELHIQLGDEDQLPTAHAVQQYIRDVADKVGSNYTPVVTLTNFDAVDNVQMQSLVGLLTDKGVVVRALLGGSNYPLWARQASFRTVELHYSNWLVHKCDELVYRPSTWEGLKLPYYVGDPHRRLVMPKSDSPMDYVYLLGSAPGWRIEGPGRPSINVEGAADEVDK